MNFFVVGLGLIAVAIPAAPFWEGEEHFNFVFGMAPRIVAASLMAFLVGSFLNAYVMSKMKVASQGRNFFGTSYSLDDCRRDCRFVDFLPDSFRRSYCLERTAYHDGDSDCAEIHV